MENASKAIIMAGGMLIAIAIVSLLVLAWKMFSSYQENKDSIANIEDTAKFNEQFAQYERDDVMGYELLSLINKIQDYDERQTVDTAGASNDKYTQIGIIVSMEETVGSDTNRKKLTFDNEVRLFASESYGTGGTLTKLDPTTKKRPKLFQTAVENTVKNALTLVGLDGKEEKASKLAKSIDGIFMTQSQVEDRAKRYYLENGVDRNNPPASELNKAINQVYNEIATKYNSITGESVSSTDVKNNFIRADKTTKSNEGKYYNAVCTYYEYMQFKKGIFKCNNIEYDTATARIKELDFVFTGEVH